MKHFNTIQALVNKGSVSDIDAALRDENFTKVNGEADKWLTKAVETYQHGCPVSAALTVEMFKHASKLSLEQVLYMEMNASLHCVNYPDFREGVRALLGLIKTNRQNGIKPLMNGMPVISSHILRQLFPTANIHLRLG